MPRESKKARIARMHQEYEQLCVEIPDPKCALNFNSPFELLVATVLSAQTTDKRVNMVTPELFGEYPGPAELAAANPEHVEDIIRTIGFFRTKARNIIGLSHELCVRFGGDCGGGPTGRAPPLTRWPSNVRSPPASLPKNGPICLTV